MFFKSVQNDLKWFGNRFRNGSEQPPESLELKMSQMLTVGHRGAGCS